MMRVTLGALAGALMLASPGAAVAEDQVCGWFAFAGAYSSERAARREANRLDVDYYDLDQSDSPNAGEGLFVVASGPYSGGSAARREARRLNREPDVDGAYAKEICFYVEE